MALALRGLFTIGSCQNMRVIYRQPSTPSKLSVAGVFIGGGGGAGDGAGDVGLPCQLASATSRCGPEVSSSQVACRDPNLTRRPTASIGKHTFFNHGWDLAVAEFTDDWGYDKLWRAGRSPHRHSQTVRLARRSHLPSETLRCTAPLEGNAKFESRKILQI